LAFRGIQVTLTLPDQLWERAALFAQRSGRDVADLLAETIELSLDPLVGSPQERPLDTWSDSEVLASIEAELPAAEDRRLSELLDRQQAATLTADDRTELQLQMHMYQEGLLRKAQAVREAVRRGLRESPGP